MDSLAQIVGGAFGITTGKKEFDHGSLQIREKTLVIQNVIYPIANISRIEVSQVKEPFPIFLAGLLAWGGSLVLSIVAAWLGVIVIAGALIALWLRYASAETKYALAIQMNGKAEALVLNRDREFLMTISTQLYEVIELEKSVNTTFNIDQKVRIDQITGSTVSVAGYRAEGVSRVQAV
jgi:Family of unknown function (DUF6232)